MRDTHRKIEPAGERMWKFWCPGCDMAHVISDAWEVDTKTVTISPSVLVHSSKHLIDSELTGAALTAPENIATYPQCHSFVTEGRIQYLGDSTHALAGQTVDLPDWVDALDEYRGQ
jgi:hypothetical protein